jgi:predicted tellurium resistance membrane protein TerC
LRPRKPPKPATQRIIAPRGGGASGGGWRCVISQAARHSSAVKATFTAVILQIMVVDLVFSLDSIITAVGMVDDVRVMIAAVVASVGLMMLFAGAIGRFVSAHPTIKMLALSFLVVVGVVLIAEGFDNHIPKGYIYFAMAFSLGVEVLNINARKRAKRVVDLHSPYRQPGEQ